jgi:2',3'-cyclic-nucleotide 2'-phosphodiesterase (5'-nucleotidase family)
MANAKSAYIINLHINKKKKNFKVKPKLELVNERIALDSATNAVVQKWSGIAEASYALSGFNAGRTVLQDGEPLDGREQVIRSQPTNLGRLVTEAMMFASPQADLAIMNAGSIRVDDILHTPISEYDIIRTLPFGGAVREVEMKGGLILQVLEQGKRNTGSGGFLLYNESLRQGMDGQWKLKETLIDPDKTYRVAIAEFLLTGKEANLGFLNPANPGITKIYEPVTVKGHPQTDIRLSVIRYLDSRK